MKRYIYISISMMTILGLSGGCASPTPKATSTPTQGDVQTHVLIDGQGGDWEAYPVTGTDVEGDQRINTPDLGEVRAFSNDRYLYLFIRLYTQGATDHYDILMDVDGGESNFQVSVWPEKNQAVFSTFPVTGDMQPLAGLSAAQDDVIEVKMPLSAVGNLPIRSIFIQTWMSGETGDMIEGLSVTLVEETDPAKAGASNPTAVVLPIPTAALTPSAPATERLGHVWISETDTLAEYAYRSFLQIPAGIVWGPDNMLYVADWTGRHVVRVAKNGTMDDLAFLNTVREFQLAGPRDLGGPRDVDFDSQGNLYVSNQDYIFRITPDGQVTNLWGVKGNPVGSIAISPADELYYTDRARAEGALLKWHGSMSDIVVSNLSMAQNIVFGLDGALYLTQTRQSQVWKVDVNTGTMTVLAENVCSFDPCFLAVDKEGDIWARGINRLSQWTPAGVEKPFVVDGQRYSGGNFPDHTPGGIAFDDEGGLWVASYNSKLIRLAPVTPGQSDPEFTTKVIAAGFEASDLEVGLNGEIYASETNTNQVLRINPDGGMVSVFDHSNIGGGRTGLAVDENGIVYVGLPNGEIVRIETDGAATHYISLYAHRMTFGADGALYAVAGDFGKSKSIVRITGVDTSEVIATEISGIPLGDGESHISPAQDKGLYVFIEETRDLLFMDFNGQGNLITNVSSLGGGGPALMAASPITGEIYLIPNGPYILFRIDLNGQSTEMASPVIGDPWGMVVSRDGRWLYIAESGAVDKIPLSAGAP